MLSPSTMNEIFQWAALVGILLLVLANYRQLGLMVTGTPEKRAYAFGPLVGKRAEDRLLGLFGQNGSNPWKLLVFVREDCTACEELLSRIDEWAPGTPTDEVQLALVVNGKEEFAAQLGTQFSAARVHMADAVLDDGNTLDGHPLLAYPFSIVMSSDGVVRHKQVGSDGDSLIEVVRGTARSQALSPAGEDKEELPS